MLIKFLLKRVAVLAIMAAVIAFFLDTYKISIPVGLLIGGFVGVYRTRLFSAFLGVAVMGKTRTGLKTTLYYLLSQAGALALLAVAAMADLRLFMGITAGLLLMPAVICVNGITEKLGISHNDWGDPA